MIQTARIIGRGIATTGLIGAGVYIGVTINPSLIGQLFSYATLGFLFTETTGLFALMMGLFLSS